VILNRKTKIDARFRRPFISPPIGSSESYGKYYFIGLADWFSVLNRFRGRDELVTSRSTDGPDARETIRLLILIDGRKSRASKCAEDVQRGMKPTSYPIVPALELEHYHFVASGIDSGLLLTTARLAAVALAVR
jgi:hypothetical protein